MNPEATDGTEHDTATASHDVVHAPSIRPQALHEANRLHRAFFGRPLPSSLLTDDAAAVIDKLPRPRNERLCMGGHRDKIFGVSLSPDGRYLASASEDSSVCIWNAQTHRLEAKLTEGLNVEYECLRVSWMATARPSASEIAEYVLASAGADGIVRLWTGTDGGGKKLRWRSAGSLDHHLLGEEGSNGGAKEADRPQIYALQFLRSGAAPETDLLLTAANDCLYLWRVVSNSNNSSNSNKNTGDAGDTWQLLPHISACFSIMEDANRFGGPRNPGNELYIFDASFSEASGLIGAALSDGTCRVVSLASDGDGPIVQEQCALSLPPEYFPGTSGGHLTALSWDGTGTRLATCIASGRVVLWMLRVVDRGGGQSLHPSCVAILEGGEEFMLF